jgi:hypothetical protein
MTFAQGTGRWLQVDPISFAAGDSNLMRYVNNNPVNASDWNGLRAVLYLGVQNSALGYGHAVLLLFDDVERRTVEYEGSGPGKRGLLPRAYYSYLKGIRRPTQEGTSEYLKGGKGDPVIGGAVETLRIPTRGDTYEVIMMRLDAVFLRLRQIPWYQALLGPNSNTYLHQLLTLAGYDKVTPSKAPAWNHSAYDGTWKECTSYRPGSGVTCYSYNKWGKEIIKRYPGQTGHFPLPG